VRATLDETPPELVADLMEQGIALAGGSSLLQGLPDRLSEETRMRVYRAEDPVSCVVRGAGIIVNDLDRYYKVLATTQRNALGQARRSSSTA